MPFRASSKRCPKRCNLGFARHVWLSSGFRCWASASKARYWLMNFSPVFCNFLLSKSSMCPYIWAQYLATLYTARSWRLPSCNPLLSTKGSKTSVQKYLVSAALAESSGAFPGLTMSLAVSFGSLLQAGIPLALYRLCISSQSLAAFFYLCLDTFAAARTARGLLHGRHSLRRRHASSRASLSCCRLLGALAKARRASCELAGFRRTLPCSGSVFCRHSPPFFRLSLTKPTHARRLIPLRGPEPLAVPIPIATKLHQSSSCCHGSAR